MASSLKLLLAQNINANVGYLTPIEDIDSAITTRTNSVRKSMLKSRIYLFFLLRLSLSSIRVLENNAHL